VTKAVASIGVMLLLQSLLAARVGTNPVAVETILPTDALSLGSARIPVDRIWFAAIVVALGTVLGALIRFTPFGLATRAVAESERGAVLTGLSPDRIAAINWALGAVVAGASGVLIAPIVPLVPISYTLFIVPAMAAALLGGFSRLGPSVAVGLVIGVLQSEATYLQNTVPWFPSAGTAELIPLLLILVMLLVRRAGIPQRGSVAQLSLGRAPLPRRIVPTTVTGAAVGIVLIISTSGNTRAAVITSLIIGVIALSQVVITGYAGQIALAQLTIAGVAAFSLSRLGADRGIPFPLAPLLAASFATVVGVVLCLPALRLRGLPAAVVTLALAVSVEAFWFSNSRLNGGAQGAPVAKPRLFGGDLSIGAGLAYPRPAFGLMCLVILCAVGVAVALLRRSTLGAQLLAVRVNERSAAAVGIDVTRVKILAYAIGAFIAGIGGSLLGYDQQVATVNSYTVLVGIGLFATVYLSGVTSILGGVFAGVSSSGGLVFVALNNWLSIDQYFAMISGLLLIVMIIRYPHGAVGPLHTLVQRFDGRWSTRGRPAASAALKGRSADRALPQAPERDPVALTVSGISVRYGAVAALDGVSFEVRSGEILGIIGPNGAGKTTLLDALSGFVRAVGAVSLASERIDRLPPHRRTRAGLGRTFQAIELYDDLTVGENVRIGASGATHGGAAVEPLLGMLSLVELTDRPVSELSQGQRQLVSVARALAGRPAVVLLDEPAAGLDTSESHWLGDRLRAVRDTGTGVVMVEHDMSLVLEVCDRVVVLDLGRKIAEGTPAEIRTDPSVVEAYLGSTHDHPPSVLAPAPQEQAT
jgi:ABC-type branched-subunit amino acid transport system ATPase component/ABC-type branched-subunit amino acid transport system permease subunit